MQADGQTAHQRAPTCLPSRSAAQRARCSQPPHGNATRAVLCTKCYLEAYMYRLLAACDRTLTHGLLKLAVPLVLRGQAGFNVRRQCGGA